MRRHLVPGEHASQCSRVFVRDLDRDMSDVIPETLGIDSAFLFERMTEVVRACLPERGRILDVAAGLGQDTEAAGPNAVAAEPSKRMTDLARLVAGEQRRPLPHWVRCWADPLPFRDDAFDAAFCKGAMDHFDAPDAAIAEMARVTRPGGCVVIAVANFSSIACRLAVLREWLWGSAPRRRAHHDVPSDHFTRYDAVLLRAQAERSLEIEGVRGVSVGWGWRSWDARLWPWLEARCGVQAARGSLELLDRVAASWPAIADVLVLRGRPRTSSTSR